MILKREILVCRPGTVLPPDAVARAVSSELQRRGCAIRSLAPGLVEFEVRGYNRHVGAMVNGGTVRISSAGHETRLDVVLRMRPPKLIGPLVLACLCAMIPMHPAARVAIFLAVMAIVWVFFDAVRTTFGEWITAAARKA